MLILITLQQFLPLVIKSDNEVATIPILCSRFESIILYGLPVYSSLAILN